MFEKITYPNLQTKTKINLVMMEAFDQLADQNASNYCT